MKKLFLLVIAVSFLISCERNGIERTARETMESTFKEIAKHPESVKFANEEIMFSNDSLCIIRADITAKNGRDEDVTEKHEYIYLLSNGTPYECIYTTEEFETYVSEEEYYQNREKEFYKDLDYPQGLYHLSSRTISTIGRKVGSKDQNEKIELPSLTGTGDWKLGVGVDEFGDEIGKNFLVLIGYGTFSNSATTNSNLRVKLEVLTEDKFFFELYEYSDHLVKNEGMFTLKIKDAKGEIYEFDMYNGDSGMTIFSQKCIEGFKQLMSKGGEISCVAEMGKYVKSQYRFKMNLTGFDKAITFIE